MSMKDDGGASGGASKGYDQLTAAINKTADFLRDFDTAIRQFERRGLLTLAVATKTERGSINLYPRDLVMSMTIGSSVPIANAADVIRDLSTDYKSRADQLQRKLDGDISHDWDGYAQQAFVKNASALIGYLATNQQSLTQRYNDTATYADQISAFVDKIQADFANVYLAVVKSYAEVVKDALEMGRDWADWAVALFTGYGAIVAALLAAAQLLCSVIAGAATVMEKLVALLVTLKEGQRNLGGDQYGISKPLQPILPSKVDYNQDGRRNDLLPFEDERQWHRKGA